MAYELREPSEDEFEAYQLPISRGFGDPKPSDEVIAEGRSLWERERSIGAIDGPEWVGGAAAFSLQLTVPGGRTTPVAGVTGVGVSATHRRQGILSAMMTQQLNDVAERDEAIAVLQASESLIYGRFGYGMAAFARGVEIACDRSAFRRPAQASGRLRMLKAAEAAEPAAVAWDRCTNLRTGSLTRSSNYWKLALSDDEHRRAGNSALFVLIHEDADGQPDGFASWRQKEDWSDFIANNTIILIDLVGTTPEVEAVLWRFVLDVDLATKVRCDVRPMDDSLRWRLKEPRQLKTYQTIDYLWLRVIDVPRALELRSYGKETSLVLEVADQFRPESGGRFRLEAGLDGASCSSSSEEPDLRLAAEELGSIYLGGIAPSALAAAGRVEECTPGSIAVADATFFTTPAPFNATMF